MKYTIHGFSQQEAVKFKKTVSDKKGKEKEIKVDCTDLLILRWFVDFYPNMMKVEIEGVQYAWVQYKKILQDLPLLDIKKQALFDRLKKLCEFKILKHKTVKVEGTFSYYGFGEMYSSLIDTECSQIHTGEYSNNEGVCSQIHTGEYSSNEQINSSIKNTPNKNDKSNKNNIYTQIIDYLNEKAETSYRITSKNTQMHINARLKEGYTVDDFKTVINKKCKEWKNTEFEQYLRPSTLFGTKFENYLNSKSSAKQPEPTDENEDFMQMLIQREKEQGRWIE